MYYNARYYDPAIGQFISPDTIVPDPSNVLDYNRYMYVRGNPINMNDPSGHCAVNSNGSADTKNDPICWGRANEYYGTLQNNPDLLSTNWGGITAEQWFAQIPYYEHITTEKLDGWLYDFWAPEYRRMQQPHDRYNPYHDDYDPTPGGYVYRDTALPGTRALIGATIRDSSECQASIYDCGRMLDNVSVTMSSLAVTCAGLALAPCAMGAAGASSLAGLGGTVLTARDWYTGGDSTVGDIAVGAATIAVGGTGSETTGFFASLFQRFWDRR